MIKLPELPSQMSILADYVDDVKDDGVYTLNLNEEQTRKLWANVDGITVALIACMRTLKQIAALPTDQLASPEQCAAVVLAMDALSALENAAAVALGSIKTRRKSKSSRANGKLGGRPPLNDPNAKRKKLHGGPLELAGERVLRLLNEREKLREACLRADAALDGYRLGKSAPVRTLIAEALKGDGE